MEISKKILSFLKNQHISNEEKLLFIYILVEDKNEDHFFHFNSSEWSVYLNVSERQLKRYTKTLYNSRLILKEYRYLKDIPGRHLFVKPLTPETEENMTFFATFEESKTLSTRSGSGSTITLKDLYNLNGTIRYRHAFLSDWDMKCEMPNNLERGDRVCFMAKFEKRGTGALFKNINNFQLIEEYYRYAI